MQKLYEPEGARDENDDVCFVRTVAGLMQIEYLSVPTKSDNEVVEQSLTGSLPILQLEDDKTFISDSLSIARYFSNGKHGFYGPDQIQRAKVEQWIDFISTNIYPQSRSLMR